MGEMRILIQSIITMMKTAQFPAIGISYWTLYTGTFFFACMLGMLKSLIGLGGGLAMGSTIAQGAGSIYRASTPSHNSSKGKGK